MTSSWRSIEIGPEWAAMFKSFTRSACRLEVLQSYAEPSERAPYEVFKRGGDPGREWIAGWCELVRNHREAGRRMERVHIVDLPLSQYLEFEIKAAYRYTGEAGEEISLLDRAKLPDDLRALAVEDFWLFDDRVVMVQEYSPEGRLSRARVSEEPGEVARYRGIWEGVRGCQGLTRIRGDYRGHMAVKKLRRTSASRAHFST